MVSGESDNRALEAAVDGAADRMSYQTSDSST
jgi:hypothetical protein